MQRRPYRSIPLWEVVDSAQWNDWHWQIANRVTTVNELSQIINLTDEEKEIIEKSLNTLRMSITPYYASLMNPTDPTCPIRMRAVPTIHETKIGSEDMLDPLHEDAALGTKHTHDLAPLAGVSSRDDLDDIVLPEADPGPLLRPKLLSRHGFRAPPGPGTLSS